MNDTDIKSRVNDSTTLVLRRVYSGRLYHIFSCQKTRIKVAICGFWSSYQWFDVDRPVPKHRLDLYPLCKNCAVAFLKTEQ